MSIAELRGTKLERALGLEVGVLANMDLGQLQGVAQTIGVSARVYARNPRGELIRRIQSRQEQAKREGAPPAPDPERALDSVQALTVAIRVLRRSRDQQAGSALSTLVALRDVLREQERRRL